MRLRVAAIVIENNGKNVRCCEEEMECDPRQNGTDRRAKHTHNNQPNRWAVRWMNQRTPKRGEHTQQQTGCSIGGVQFRPKQQSTTQAKQQSFWLVTRMTSRTRTAASSRRRTYATSRRKTTTSRTTTYTTLRTSPPVRGRTQPRERQHDLKKEGDVLNLLDVLLLEVVYDLKSTEGDMPTRRD